MIRNLNLVYDDWIEGSDKPIPNGRWLAANGLTSEFKFDLELYR